MDLTVLDKKKVQGALEDIGAYNLDMARRIAVAFDEKQWKYFPMQLSKVGQRWGQSCVLPCVDRQLINDKGGTSNVYEVAVLERFVPDEMKAKGASSMEPHLDFRDLGDCCHFALKVYKTENHQIFKNELQMYKMMTKAGNKGMLTYLGDLTLADGNDTTHTIILEYADGDLTEYFYRTSPVLPMQILQFWNDISAVVGAVRDLHNFKINQVEREYKYEGWHADIKPDNTLVVNGKFKLADPGFAKFERHKEEVERPRKDYQFTGGTTTYGAPERHSSVHAIANPRAADMWSLGCVLSEAATWIVLGPSGVRQFRDLRVGAIQGQSHQSEPGRPPLGKRRTQCDSFHDGKQRLREVGEWHGFLRQLRLSTNVLTDKVIQLIDQHLLVANPDERFEAGHLCKWFEEYLSGAQLATKRLDPISNAVREAISSSLERESEELLDHLDPSSQIVRETSKVVPVDTSPIQATKSKPRPRPRIRGRLSSRRTTIRTPAMSFRSDFATLDKFRRLDNSPGQPETQHTIDHERALRDVHETFAGSIMRRPDCLDAV